MLAHTLAMAIALGSFSLYMAAFFFPEVHRKYDFIWSGVGFFYALVLWVCAGRITGGVLLGQTASVALLGWFGWQTLEMRRRLTPASQQTQLPGSAKTLGEFLQFKLAQFQETLQGQLDRPRSGSGFAPLITRGLATAIALFQGLLNTTKPKKKKPTIIINRPPRAERVTPPVQPAPVASVKPVVEPIAALEQDERIEVVPDKPIVPNVLDEPLQPITPSPAEKFVSPRAVSPGVKRSAPKSNPFTVLQTRIQEILDRFKRSPQPTSPISQEAIPSTSEPTNDADLDAEFDELFSDLDEPARDMAAVDDSDWEEDFADEVEPDEVEPDEVEPDEVEPTVEVEVVAMSDPLTEAVIIQETIGIEDTPIEAIEAESLASNLPDQIASEERSSETEAIEEDEFDVSAEAKSEEPPLIEVTERSESEPEAGQPVMESTPEEAVGGNEPNAQVEAALEEGNLSQEAIEDDHISVLGDGVAIEDTTEQQPS